jgi:membrane-associated phospholipid phosphatase
MRQRLWILIAGLCVLTLVAQVVGKQSWLVIVFAGVLVIALIGLVFTRQRGSGI